MQEYGLSGSGTYAVSFLNVDDMMSVLPNNNVNQISARNLRDVIYTLWVNGGGAGGSFSYTQGFPLERKSIEVGGVPKGTNFVNVPLQVVLDTLFFKQSDNTVSIDGTGSFEYGFPNPRVNLIVKLNQNNDNLINFAEIRRSSENVRVPTWPLIGTTLEPIPNLPTVVNTIAQTTYNNEEVHRNNKTTWTLSARDINNKPYSDTTTATWFLRRFWGSIDLSSFGSTFNIFNATPQQLTAVINALSDINVRTPGVEPLNSSSSESQLGEVDFVVPGLRHIWFAWPSTDYTNGVPSQFQDSTGKEANIFRRVTTRNFENQYNYVTSYDFWVVNYPQGSTTVNVVV
jgi:hypothetical protein